MSASTVPEARASAPPRPRDGRPRRLAGRPRRLVRAGHVAAAGGWLGLVVAMLALGIAGATGSSGAPPAATYRLMDLIGGAVIPPLAVVTLLSGVALSLLTPWGLVRHRWIVAKTVIGLGVIVTAVTRTDAWLEQAITAAPAGDDVGARLVVTSVVHVAALTFATVVSVDKPWGLTAYGRRRRERARAGGRRRSTGG